MNDQNRIEQLERRVELLTRSVERLSKLLANLPAEWPRGGGGGGQLPAGTGRGKVLMLIDEESPGTVGWDYPIFPVPVGDD